MAANLVTSAVRDLYETFPYPRYPLFAKPRWQDGYLASSAFARRLAFDLTGCVPKPRAKPVVLSAGCGDMQPYILRRWEPSAHQLVFVDLSQKSLARARMRLLGRTRCCVFVAEDLAHYLAQTKLYFEHIDCYGVLHHLASPQTVINLCAQRLLPGGTMRVMIYNPEARGWIHNLQKIFGHLGLSPQFAKDRRVALQALKELGKESETYRAYLKGMRSQLKNPSRLADTFFHPREARIPWVQWERFFTESGLKIYSWFDRFCEWEQNVLWKPPKAHEVSAQQKLGAYEFWVVKPASASVEFYSEGLSPLLKLMAPPSFWPRGSRGVWREFLRSLQGLGKASLPREHLLEYVRLGGVFPGSLGVEERRRIEETNLEVYSAAQGGRSQLDGLGRFLAEVLKRRKLWTPRRWAAVEHRVARL